MLDTSERQTGVIAKASGVIAFILGFIDLSIILLPSLHRILVDRLDELPGVLGNAAVVATVFRGVILMLLADGLARRKHRTWLVTVWILALSVAAPVVLDISSGRDFNFVHIYPALFLVGLIYARAQFYALPDSRSFLQSIKLLFLSCTIALIGGIFVTYFRLQNLGMPLSFQNLTTNLIPGFFGIETSITQGEGRGAYFTYFVLLALGICSVLPALVNFLAAPNPKPVLSPADDFEIRQLLDQFGSRDSLGYFSLRRDKSVVWAENRKACIAYRVTMGVMLASGDPIGDPDAWPEAIDAFVQMARMHGWIPAVAGASELGARVWTREANLNALEIGDEAILEPATFTLEGRSMRNVRQMVNRTYRLGYTAIASRTQDLAIAESRELGQAADLWRNGKTERGYSMALGRIGEPQDGQTVVVRAFKDEKLMAFVSLVPWGENGVSLDLMRRSPDCNPGLNDLLICSLMDQAPALGITQVSLNFATFRAILDRGERLGATPLTRLNRKILVFASRWVQIDSLYRFNEKFGPKWQPRFLLYQGGREFPRAGLAFLKAEGFIRTTIRTEKKV